MMASAIAKVSKYLISDQNSGINVGRHPLVAAAKKAFWQHRLPLLRYCGNYDIRIIFKFIENLDENKSMFLKHMSSKTVFLVAFSTLPRYCRSPEELIRI